MINAKSKRTLILFGMLGGLSLGCNDSNSPASGVKSTTKHPATVTAQRPVTTEHPAATTEPADRENTGVNVRDRSSAAKTPLDQNETKADVKVTAAIRKRVVDANLSLDAHNVKIITQDGKVTLRGPVKSDEEKQQIEKIAASVAGADKVDSQLEVAAE